MLELFTHAFQYLSILIVFLLMISSYSLLRREEEETVFGFRVNVALTLLLAITLFAPVILRRFHPAYLIIAGGTVAFLLIYPWLFRKINPQANRLLINLVMIMLAIGMPVLLRLNYQKANKQFVFMLAASLIALFVPLFLRRFEAAKKMAGFLGVLGLLMLIAVLVLSRTTYGANLSLQIGSISVQPSEFVKLTYVLLMSSLFLHRQDFKRVSLVALIAIAHTAVLVLSKDLGSAVIYYSVFVVILYVATGKRRYPIMASAVLAAGGVAAYYLFAHVRVRVVAWVDPWSVIQQQGYQIAQSLFSIAEGGFLGKGMYLGNPGYVPVVEKDFIFSAICEELGGVFGICLIMLVICLVLCMIKVAMKNTVVFYKLIGVGLATCYGIQAFLTIGGAERLIPSTGVTLPYVSYGGSSLVSGFLLFSLMQGLFIKGNLVESAKRLDREIKEAVQEKTEVDENGHTVVRRRVKVPNKSQQKILKRDDTKTASVTNKNHASVVLGYAFMMAFSACMIGLVYFLLVEAPSDTIQKNSYYLARGNAVSERVIRGSVVGNDGVVLAYTETDENGEEHRVYPFANLFAHVVGYTDGGTYGIENMANKYLLQASRTISEQLEMVPEKKAEGDTVQLSIDPSLQYVAYQALGDRQGAVVVMEADTGRILALVSKPDFDPNDMRSIWDHMDEFSNGESFLVNRATMGQYPPGSTFKLLTMLGYVREHPEDFMGFAYDCPGVFTYDKVTLHCAESHVHGHVNLWEALQQSCNGAFAKIGTGLQNKTLQRLADEFGFNQSFSMSFPYKKSVLNVTDDTTAEERTQLCIGQGTVLETPLHNAMITASIANGGVMMRPRLIDRISSSTGRTVETMTSETIGRTMSAAESAWMEKAMLSVVEEGTAFNAKSDAYYSAGKTGSAQYGTQLDQLHAWYTGYAWQENSKKIVVSVLVEQGGSGGWYAAPVAKMIFDQYFLGNAK